MANGGRIDFTVGFNVDKSGLEQIKNQLNQLSQISKAEFANLNPGMNTQQVTASFKKVQSTITEVKKAYSTAFDSTTGITNINKLSASLNKIGFNNIAADFNKLGVQGVQAFNNMGRQILSTNLKFKETNNLIDKMGKTLGNTIKWSIASSAVNSFTGAIQQAYGYVQHLDTSLNDIRIVTSKSADEMDKFAAKANNAAKALGASTTDYTEAALIYYQQGLNDEESQARAETTLKAANVTGQTGREVSEQLTAVWNGYKVTAEETELYVDKLAAVAASTAADLEELSTGMSKVASAANNMGVDIDQLNAQLATIVSVTRQAPETAGTALKTIYARMEDLKISGEDEEGVKLGEVSSTLEEVGVQVMDTSGDLRDLGEVIEEVASKWDTWTGAQQNAIAQALAGKRQYNNLLALFDNWDMYTEALETSRDAAGTLQKQQDIYMESTAAHLQQLKTEWEDLYDSILDTKDINSLVDIFSSLLDKVTLFIDAIGGGKGVLTGLGAVAMNVFNKQISIGLSETIQKFQNSRDNAKLLNQEIERVANIKGIDKTTQAFQTLVDLKKQMASHVDLMTNEEVQEMDQAIDQIIELAMKKDELTKEEQDRLEVIKQEIKAEEELIQKLAQAQVSPGGKSLPGSGGKAAQNIDIADGKGIEESQKTLQYADQLLEKNGAVEQSWQQLEGSLENYINTIQEFEALEKEYSQDPGGISDENIQRYEELQNIIPQLGDEVKNLYQELSMLFEQSGIEDNLKQRLENVFKSFEKFSSGKSKTARGIKTTVNSFKKDLPDAVQTTRNKLKEAQSDLPKLDKAIHETAEQAKNDINNVDAQFKQMSNDFKQNLKTLDLRDTISGLTNFASGLTSVFFAYQSIKNLGNIWNQEDISLGDKVAQTMMNLGMVIPNVINGIRYLSEGWGSLKNTLSNIPQLLNTIQIGMVTYSSGMSSVATAQKLLNSLSDDERNTLLQNIGLQNLEIDTLTEQDAELIINAHLKATNGDTTQLLGEKSLFAAGANKTLGNALKFIKSPAGAVTIALLAVAAAAFAVNKAEDAAAKRVAEASKEQAEAAQKQVEATQQHLEAVKQLTQEYDNLKESYSDDNIEELRKKVYDLCQQYGVQIDMLRLMKANYEELQQIIDDLNLDALTQVNDATLDSINKQSQYLIDNAKQVEAETITTFNHFYLILSKIASLEFPFLDQFTNFNKLSGNFNNLKALMTGTSTTIPNIVSTDMEGKVQIDWDKYYAASEEEQKQVEEYLEKTYEGFLGSVWSIFDKSGQAALKAVRENKENQDKIEEQKKEYNKSKTDEIYSTEFADISITNASDYNETKEQLAERIKTDLEVTEEEALKLAEEKLAASDNAYTIKSAITVGTELAPSYGKSAEEVADEYGNLSTVEQNFVSENLNLASAYKSLDEFIDTYHDTIERENNNQENLNVGIALTNSDGKEFKPEDLDKLFSMDGFEQSLGKSREEFEAESYDQQIADLSVYYIKANQLENDFQQNKLKHLQDENTARQQEIDTQTTQLEGIKDTVLQQFEGVKESDLFEGIANNLEQQLQDAFNDINFQQDFDFLEGSDNFDIAEALEAAIDPSKELNECQEHFIEILKEKNNYDDEDIKLLYNKIQANKEYQKELENSNLPDEIKNAKSYSKAIDKLNGKSLELEAAYKKLDKSSIDWNAYKKGVNDLKKSTNSAIDSLQGAYNSLNSVMDEYNSTQVLSMDNLQTLLDMDTAYLSALQIEDGQMTLNEESLKQIALAKLDEAEAEAYAQAMEELHNEETRQAILGQQQAVISLNSLGGAAVTAAEAARSGTDAWREYWDAALNREGIANDAYAQQVGQGLQNKLQAIDQVRQQIMSGGFKQTMQGPEKASSASSSESKKEAQHEEYLERERDIYREINEELEQIESTLGRIQKQNSYKWGKDLQKGLQQENKLLDKQLDKLKQKAKLQKADLGQRRATLEKEGIKFSKDGSTMKNAEDKIDKLYKEYNSMVDKYNSMSADQQENYKKSLDAKKKDIDKIEKSLSDYESLFSDYQSTLDEILDKHYEQIENNVEKFNNMVDVHLELDEARKEWDDFWYEVIQDVDDTDFGGMLAKSMSKLKTLIGVGGDVQNSQIAVLTEHLNKTVDQVQAQIDSRKRGGEDSLFQDATKLSKENLEKYRDSLMEAVREAKEELDNMSDNYLKTLASAQELIDKQIDGLESINDHLEHNVELIKLVSGEEAYEPIIQQYEKIYQNNLKMLDTQKKSKDTWAENIDKYTQLLKTTEKGTLLYKTYEKSLEESTENYKKAVSDLDKSLEKTLKDLQAKNDAQISSIRDTFDKNLSNQMGLESMEHQWNLINEDADRYLDSVEKSIELQLYANDLNDAAEATGLTAANQQRLNQFRDDELKKLREKEKLTQYDIDESRARLEILKQEMVLEDQRNNKSNMRLRRDSQGNYNYQYVGDAEAEEEAEEGLLTAKKAWYDLVKKRNIETTKEIIEIRKQIVDEWNQYQETGDERYFKNYQMLVKQHNDLMVEAKKAATDMTDGVALYFSDVMTNDILPQNKAAAREMILMWDDKSKESFLGATEQAITDLRTVQEQFKQDTTDALTAAGISYKEDLIEGGIDPTLDKLEDMVMSNEELDEALKEVNDSLGEQATALKDAESAYNDLKDAAVEALEEANRALEELSQTAIDTKNNVIAAVQATQAAAAAQQQLQNGANSVGANNGGTTGGNTNTTTSGTKYRWTMGTSNGGQKQIFIWKVGDNSKPVKSYNLTSASDPSLQQIKKQWNLIGLKSGGYTGDWNTPGVDGIGGRMAVLHQKELVLNESDTSNLLKAVSVLRNLANVTSDFSGLADNLISSSMMWRQQMLNQSVTSGNAIPQSFSTTSTNDYKNFVVNADFSGVRSADEIYQALLELENYGVQQAYSSAPIANRSY